MGEGHFRAGYREGQPGSVNIPVVCAGALVNPGDVIVADADGVVVVPRETAAEVAKAGATAHRQGRENPRAPAKGELGVDFYGLRAKLKELGVEYIDEQSKRGDNSMGKIVAAAATVHAPQFSRAPPSEDPAQLDADIAAMRELGKNLDETKPDAAIVIGSDHLETFFLSAVPTFAIVGGRTSKAAFARKSYDLPIHPLRRRTARQAGRTPAST